MNSQEPAKYFWMGAGAVLAGMVADRLLRSMNVANLSRAAYALREIRHAFGHGAPEPVVLNPDGAQMDDEDLPPSYRQRAGGVSAPPPSEDPRLDPVYMPSGEVVPLTEEEDAEIEARAIFQQMTTGEAIDVNWQYA